MVYFHVYDISGLGCHIHHSPFPGLLVSYQPKHFPLCRFFYWILEQAGKIVTSSLIRMLVVTGMLT